MKFQNNILSFGTFATAALALGLLAGCNGSKTPGNGVASNPIKLGLVASQNGPLRPWGSDCIKGAQLAVDQINAAGGINGRQVLLMVGDSNSNPEQGKSAAEKLISDGVVAILGEIASGITQPIATLADENGIPLITPGATKTTITDIGPGIFRVCYTDDFQGPVMATFAYESLELRRIAIMTDKKQPYSTYLSGAFRDKFISLGGEIVAEEFYESGNTNFLGQITKIKATNPDGMFMSGYFTEVGPIAEQADQQGLRVKFLGGDGWDSSELVNSAGDAIIGGFFCNHYNSEDGRPEVLKFLEDWDKKYSGKPGTTMAPLAYDAAMIMMDAMKRADSLGGQDLIDAIENTVDYPGVSGSITLKGMGGDPHKRAIIVRVTAEGQSFAKAIDYEEIFGEEESDSDDSE